MTRPRPGWQTLVTMVTVLSLTVIAASGCGQRGGVRQIEKGGSTSGTGTGSGSGTGTGTGTSAK